MHNYLLPAKTTDVAFVVPDADSSLLHHSIFLLYVIMAMMIADMGFRKETSWLALYLKLNTKAETQI